MLSGAGPRAPAAKTQADAALLEPSNRYVIVQVDGRDGYGQAWLNDDGTFAVEYRGGPHDDWQALATDAEVAYEVLSGWASERPGWRDRLEWKVLDLGF